MRPCHEPLRLDNIIMEPSPLIKRIVDILLIRLVIPVQHGGVILDADAATKRLDHGRRLVEQIIRIDDTDLVARSVAPRGADRLEPALELVGVLLTGRDVRADQPLAPQVVERAAQLVVPGLGRVVVVEAGHVVQRGDRAAVVRRHAVVRVADEERKVEAGEELPGHHCWIAAFLGGCRRRRLRGRGSSGGWLYGGVGAYAALDPVQGRGDVGGFAVRREQVVHDVLDEDSFALFEVSMSSSNRWNGMGQCVER